MELKDYNNLSKERTSTFNEFLSRTFVMMFGGVALTALIAFLTYFLFLRDYNNLPFYTGLSFFVLIGQFVLCIYFSARINKMSPTSALVCYGIYSACMGITLGMLPILYEGSSIVIAIVMTAVLFACMAIIGHTTRIDLSKYSSLFMIGLVMVIIISLLNVFLFHSSGVDMMLNYVGVILFLGIIAWDMQKLRAFYTASLQDSELASKVMVYSAFELYLDFMNVFLRILAIFGNSRDNR